MTNCGHRVAAMDIDGWGYGECNDGGEFRLANLPHVEGLVEFGS